MSRSKRALVTGAGGFIGHHLATFLKKRGYWVRGVDVKKPEFTASDADEFLVADLRVFQNCAIATADVDEGLRQTYIWIEQLVRRDLEAQHAHATAARQ